MPDLNGQQFEDELPFATAAEAARQHVEKLHALNEFASTAMDTPIKHEGLSHFVQTGGGVMFNRLQAHVVASRLAPRSWDNDRFRKLEDVVYEHGMAHAQKLGVPTKYRVDTDPLYRLQLEEEAREARRSADEYWRTHPLPPDRRKKDEEN